MQVVDLKNFKVRRDEQIQIGCARLQVAVELANGMRLDAAGVSLRVKIVDNVHGTVDIHQLTPLKTLFEEAAQREGFYVRDENQDEQPWTTEGFVDITPGPSLGLGAQRYISLDIESNQDILGFKVWAVPAPLVGSTYEKKNPMTVQGVAKDVPLNGVNKISLRPKDLNAVRIQFDANNAEYSSRELYGLGYMMNDIVSVNKTNGTATYGIEDSLVIDVTGASRMLVEPATQEQITIYLFENKTL